MKYYQSSVQYSLLPCNCYFVPGGLGYTWGKNFCMYTKENKILTMVPYVQTQSKMVSIHSLDALILYIIEQKGHSAAQHVPLFLCN